MTESNLLVVHIIDDDTSLRVAMKRRLELAGFNVRTYAAAEQFLEHGDVGQSPGCLVLDVEMPGMSGLELQNRLRALGSTLPIVFVSGCVDDRISAKAVEAGAQDFLTKPINSDQLLRSINAAMARQEAVCSNVALSAQFANELLARASNVIVEARLLREQNRQLLTHLRLGVSRRRARATFVPKRSGGEGTRCAPGQPGG